MNTTDSNSHVTEASTSTPALIRHGAPYPNLVQDQNLASFGATPSPMIPPATPDFLTLMTALRRRSRLVAGVGSVLAILVAVAAWYLIPPSKYTARALLQVASFQPKVIFKTEENRVDFPTYQKTQQMLIKSRTVLNKALNDPKVSKLDAVRRQVDPVLWLEKQIQADYLGEVFRISMSGDKPDELAALVNAVTEAYRREVVDVESKERWQRHDELKKIYDEYQTKLEQQRSDLKKRVNHIGTKDKQSMRFAQEMATERLSLARRELIQTQGERRKAQAELDIIRAQNQEVIEIGASDLAVTQFIEEDTRVRQLRMRMAELKVAIGRTSRLVREKSDPSLQPKLVELDTVRKLLEARVAALRPVAIESLTDGKQVAEGPAVKSLSNRIAILDELIKVTQTICETLLTESKEINDDTLYINDKQDEISHADNAAKRIGEELESLSVELRAPSRVRQLETADVPRREDDKRVVMAGIAGCGTFGLFALGIAFLEFRARRISTIDEVTRWLGLRVVGALPPIRLAGRRTIRENRRSGPYGENLLAESIDSIRTMILHSTGNRSLGSIMITSAASGEGKTSLACHLATSLARSGLKTLLIDCDLRKPTIHRLYDVPATPGFSEFLRGEADAVAVIHVAGDSGPDLVPAGACDALALQALSRADSGAIFDQFRSTYDIIIVDTSPILPVTDALLVGRHVDAAVYSILRDVSRLPWTSTAVNRLRSMNIRLLGAVVTGVRSQAYGSYYGSYAGGVKHG